MGRVPALEQDALDPLVGDDGARQLAEHPAEGTHGEGEDGDEVGDLDDLGGGHRPAAHPCRAGGEDDERGELRDGLDDGVEGAAGATDGDVGLAQPAGDLGETACLALLGPHRLHDERRLERLVGDLAHLGAQLLGGRRQRRHPALVDAVGDHEQREADEPDEHHHRVDESHLDEAEGQHDEHAERHGQRHEDEPRRLDVGVRVRQELAGGVAVVPRQRQTQVLARDAASVVGRDAVHDHRPEDAPAEHADRRRGDDGRDRAEDDRQAAPVDLAGGDGGRHVVLGDPADGPGHARGGHAEDHAADDREGEGAGGHPHAPPDDAQRAQDRRELSAPPELLLHRDLTHPRPLPPAPPGYPPTSGRQRRTHTGPPQ